MVVWQICLKADERDVYDFFSRAGKVSMNSYFCHFRITCNAWDSYDIAIFLCIKVEGSILQQIDLIYCKRFIIIYSLMVCMLSSSFLNVK